MRTVIATLSVVGAVTLWSALAAAPIEIAEAEIAERDTINRTLRWSGSGDHVLELSNINGSIRIVGNDQGNDRPDVEMVADRTIRADSADAVAEARRNVRLEITEGTDLVRICADAEHCGCGGDQQTRRRGRDWKDDWRDAYEERYRVYVDFVLHVPKTTKLRLCTINHGDLTVEATEGDFDLRNVNGGIELTGVRGSGNAVTVNGSVKGSFAAAPKAASSFKTVNGEIEVRFPRDLAADLRLKTLNGGLYTDFDVTPLSTPPPVAARRNGKFVYRSNQFATVRSGLGGPELTFQSLNGDVRVLAAQ